METRDTNMAQRIHPSEDASVVECVLYVSNGGAGLTCWWSAHAVIDLRFSRWTTSCVDFLC